MLNSRRIRVLLGVCALLIGSAFPALGQAAQRAQPADVDAVISNVDAYMQAQTAHNDFSGAILLARDGQPLVAKGYGFANVEWQVPNTVDTKFRIGSVTKQFTSMVIMLLREQGKVKLEDSVCAYVTPCPETWTPVTIHHLLTHSSGIPSYTGLPEWREVRMQPHTIEQMIGFFRDLPLQWSPGEKYAYNNSGYFLLGVVIEKITGRKYEDVLREMIFTPLGMKDTGYDWPTAIIPRRAAGYAGTSASLANATPIDMQQPYAAGALYSTVEDLLIWDQALYTEKLLPAAAKQKMWTPVLQNYAYGWAIRPASPQTFGYERILHGGGIDGFSAHFVRVPEANVTAIVLSNNSTNSSSTIANDLLAIYFGQPYKVPGAAMTLGTDVLDRYVGEYELRPGFVITIWRDGGRLLAQATGQPQFELFAASPTKFFAKVVPVEMSFTTDPAGRVIAATLHQNGEQALKKIK